MSDVEWGDFLTRWDTYRPMPSWVIPRSTLTPVVGTSANFNVLFRVGENGL